jgi:predicted choloylglycine hydrolase
MLLHIKTKGSPFERGKQQGELSKTVAMEWIIPCIQELDETYKANKNIANSLEDILESYKSSFRRVYSEGYEECCGIASGLNVSENDYFKAIFSWRFLCKFQNCTSIGFYEQERIPILGKTDDIYKDELGSNILEITHPEEGYKHMHFHFAGSIWTTAGINECGLSIGMTGIPGVVTDEDGYMSLDALHTILPKCETVGDVVSHIKSIKLNYYGFSLIVGDEKGGLSLIEKTGNGTVEIMPLVNGFYIHTNHILNPELAARNPSQKEPIFSNGIQRYKNALSLTRTMPKTEEGMMMFLNNRNPEGAIRQQGENGLFTDYGVMFKPVEKKFIYFSGYPNYKTNEVDCRRILQVNENC